MKKFCFLFHLLCLAGFFSNHCFSQKAYITSTAPVKVKEATLVYFGGGLTLKNEVNVPDVVVNEGNIIIKDSYENSGIAAGAEGRNFVSTWTDDSHYGQVIIDQEVNTTSKLTMEKPPISSADFSWGQFAIPYDFATPQAAMQSLFGKNYSNGANRYYASMMKWDNLQKPEFDQLNSTGTGAGGNLHPGDYVILNLTYYSANIRGVMEDATGGNLRYAGIPTNGTHPVSFNVVNNYEPNTVPWSIWKDHKNSYNEKYSTYIFDEVRQSNVDDYGRYYFQFGNPYTSNIDLSSIISQMTDLVAISRMNSADWEDGTGGSVGDRSSVRATRDGANWSGSPDALIVRPFETFVIGLDRNTEMTQGTFTFNDDMKTFSSTSKADEDGLFGKMIGNSVMEATSARSTFYQLRLKLYNSDDQYTRNEVYVVVMPPASVQNGVPEKLESEYADFNGRTGFYLAQENADGSEVTTSDRKLYINAVNFKYASKPIQLFFNRKANDYEGYYVKADLFYRDIFHKLDPEDVNFYGNNSFYFYDKFEDVLLPITTDFSYYIEISDEPVDTRYQVFWNGGPQQNKAAMGSDELTSSETIIYKDHDTHKIRFNKEWSSADIKVYDLTGKNILTHEGVKTDVDFELKLPQKGVYVVKIESNTGGFYTQKIINQ